MTNNTISVMPVLRVKFMASELELDHMMDQLQTSVNCLLPGVKVGLDYEDKWLSFYGYDNDLDAISNFAGWIAIQNTVAVKFVFPLGWRK